MKLTETLKRRIDTFFRNLTDEEKEYLIENYFNKHEKAINYKRCCKSDSEQLCECKNTEPEIDGWVRCKDCGNVFMV